MFTSPNGVKTLAPAGAIKPTGPWSLGTRAGDFIYVAGMRGIDPGTDILVHGDEARTRQAYINMKRVAESEGATLRDTVRLVVYVTDMLRLRSIVNKVQEELWSGSEGSYRGMLREKLASRQRERLRISAVALLPFRLTARIPPRSEQLSPTRSSSSAGLTQLCTYTPERPEYMCSISSSCAGRL
jgi:enamine deaminase RidA (YjgF/YER057c/UK114 family)